LEDQTSPASTSDAELSPPSLDRIEWEHIQRVLAENAGNISETARQLGMHRRTLQRKLQKRPAKK
jgi:two-component system response regulator RegA